MNAMPRQGRKLSSSKIYHVMIRGNERKDIFFDDEDRAEFLDLLQKKKQAGQYFLYAYCLMNNHVHLLIHERTDGISKIMKRINISYAYYFNQKYERIGHLFQDRFKSQPIENNEHLLAAVRYIHQNPVKALITKHPSEYSWSSYNLYMNHSAGSNILIDPEFIMALLSTDREKALRLLAEFTTQDCEFQCIEYLEVRPTTKLIQNESKAKLLIAKYLFNKQMCLADLKNRDNTLLRTELIGKLKSGSTLSVRQIANILDLDRNVVQRVESETIPTGG